MFLLIDTLNVFADFETLSPATVFLWIAIKGTGGISSKELEWWIYQLNLVAGWTGDVSGGSYHKL